MRLLEVFSIGSPLSKLTPQEKREVEQWVNGTDEEMDERSPAFLKLMDYYQDEMPPGVQSGKEGLPDEWIFDQLQGLPEFKGA